MGRNFCKFIKLGNFTDMPKSLVTRASGFRKILIVSCKYTLTASIGTVCLIDEKLH
jgi:hypothetical protein